MNKKIVDFLTKDAVALAKNFYIQAEPIVKPKLELFWKYAKIELRPPGIRDVPDIRTRIENIIQSARNGKWRDVPVREAWLNALVTTEVVCWFFVGEVIGRHHIVGYKV